MPAAARLGDKAQIESCAHGCPACPHPATGPIIVGSANVNINGLPAGRADNTDLGMHAACCGPNIFSLAKGSATVYVNDKPLARMNDQTKHCGGNGKIIEGSPDVLIDDGGGQAGTLVAAVAAVLEVVNLAAAAFAAGTAQTHSDTHADSSGAPPAQDLASAGTAAEDKKSGSISSCGWNQTRASNGQEVEIQVACKNGKGSLKIEIWARSHDPSQDKCVQKIDAQAGDDVKQKVKLDIPGDSAPGNECFFYYVVKDDQGGEKKSPAIYVDRAPFRFST